jgi:hypothetical protein
MSVWVYPAGIKGSQARSKKPLQPKAQEARNRAPEPKLEAKTNCAFPSQSNRKPSPRPRPRLSMVCPALALPGLPLPRRASVCPFLAGAPPSPFLSLPSFSGRSARLSGALRPRRVGFSLARRVGFSRSWAVPVCPRSAGGGGGGLASGLCALPGLRCVPGRFRPP